MFLRPTTRGTTMSTVANILSAKGHVVYRVAPQETIFTAVRRMAAHEIGSLLVVDDEGRAVGLVTERDCLRRIVLEDRSPRATPVEVVMNRDTHAVPPDASIEHCMRVMTNRRVRHLPVTDGQAVVGIVSIGDVVKTQIVEHRSNIEQMTQYIQGRA
jgi:CBS domain-containing protein